MLEIDPYRFRMNGDYLIAKTCEVCGKRYDVHAMQNSDADCLDLCGACRDLKKTVG